MGVHNKIRMLVHNLVWSLYYMRFIGGSSIDLDGSSDLAYRLYRSRIDNES